MACFRTFLGISGILAAIAGIVLVGSFRAIFDLVLEKVSGGQNDFVRKLIKINAIFA